MLTIKKNHSLIGLGLHGKTVTVLEAQHSGEGWVVRRSLRTQLSHDPLLGETQRAGHELQSILQQAGVTARQCLVCLPVHSLLTLLTPMPNLPKEDEDSYLNILAERELPFAPEDLCCQFFHFHDSQGNGHASLTALLRQRVESVQETLRHAHLTPVGLTVGAIELGSPDDQSDAFVLVAEPGRLELVGWLGGQPALLRSFNEYADNLQQEQGPVDWAGLAPQLRMTLAQLPPVLRERIHTLNIVAQGDLAQEALRKIAALVEPLGLKVTATLPRKSSSLSSTNEDPCPALDVFASMTRYLSHGHTMANYLPPKQDRFAQLVSRISDKGTVWGLGAAGALLLLLLATFMWQHHTLSKLETQWAQLEPHVQEAQTMQQLIRDYRPWYSNSAPSLEILTALTQAFPEEGRVWVKSLSIKEISKVTCSGLAQSNSDWLTMHDALLTQPGVTELQVQQIRDNNPLQFSLSYQWAGGSEHGL